MSHEVRETHGSGMRILIIDDSRFTRALLRRDLESEHEVIEAPDGLQALSLVATEAPDLIFVDLLMPQMDGFGFLKETREAGFLGPIIVCSASTQPSVESRIKELGATAFVAKPELLIPGRARALVADLNAIENDVDAAPDLHPDEILEQAMTTIAGLVRGSHASSEGSESEALTIVHVAMNLGAGVTGTSRLTVGGEMRCADPRPGSADLPDAGRGLVRAFLARLAGSTSRSVSLRAIRCEEGVDAEDASVRLSARFDISGMPPDSEMVLSLGAQTLLEVGARIVPTVRVPV